MAGKTAYGRTPRARRMQCAAASVLAAVLFAGAAAFATPQGAAWADELGTGTGDSAFDLNLVMSVEPADDPANPLGTQDVDVRDEAGRAVAGARVSFSFEARVPDAPAAESTAVSDGAASSQTQAALSGSVATDGEGKARLDNLPIWCSYAVTVESEGFERYEDVLVCRGDGEPWRVVLAKADEGGTHVSGGPGTTGGAGVEGGATRPGASDASDGSDVVARPLFPFGWLLPTGDSFSALSAVLALAGLALVGAALAVLARRKAREGGDVR